jgi:hypothetical protein
VRRGEVAAGAVQGPHRITVSSSNAAPRTGPAPAGARS